MKSVLCSILETNPLSHRCYFPGETWFSRSGGRIRTLSLIPCRDLCGCPQLSELSQEMDAKGNKGP